MTDQSRKDDMVQAMPPDGKATRSSACEDSSLLSKAEMPSKSSCGNCCGLEEPNASGSSDEPDITSTVTSQDLEFLMRTELLRVAPQGRKRLLLDALSRVTFPPGERIVNQGTTGDRLFILHKGSCVVNLEKNQELHSVGRLKTGDVFGEMALITGDYRSAHIDAETEVTVWTLDRDSFERICDGCPELIEYLTDLATERLCSRRITAEKNIGRYRITDVIAEGGWSIVYKGFHSALGLPVAVKMLKHSMALDSDFFETFRKEAETIAGLNHDNIVRVYDIEHEYKTVFIIMEYLSGITLRQIVSQGFRMPLSRVLKILNQIAAALDYAHGQGVVHQDVKPGNVFVQEEDRVKIVDFGLATPIGGCSDDLPGTPYYMAPEQIEGDPVDARTDIYSLGITAYEMATGEKPFPDDICQVLEYHITKTIPDPRELNSDLPEDFALFVKKATEKTGDARFQNMSEVLSALNSIAKGAGFQETRESLKKRRMKSLNMFYEKEQEPDMARILDEFSQRLRDVGAELRLASFDDV